MNDDDDNSDGVPQVRRVLHAEPTDQTIRGFKLTMDSIAVTADAVPTRAPTEPTLALGSRDTVADGSIDEAAQRCAPGVPVISDDAPTMQVTPLDVGYRFAVLRQLAIIVAQGGHTGPLPHVRHVNGQRPVEVCRAPNDPGRVLLVIRRWRDVAAWVRHAALDDFVVLKAALQNWPDEVRVGARAVLRQLTEACHKPQTPAADGYVYLLL